MKKLYQNLSVKVKKEFLLSSPASFLFFLVLLFLPTQFGKHFWPEFSFVSGLRIDYLSPTLYFTDVLILLLIIFSFKSFKKIRFSLPIAVFLIFLSMGIFLSKTPLPGIYFLLKGFEFSFLGFYIAKNTKKLSQIIFPLALGLIFESLLTVWQYFIVSSVGGIFYFLGERTFNSATPGIANASLGGSLTLRPYGTFSHPNVLAGYLLFSMTVLLFSSISKAYKTALIILGSFSLILTLGRVAILCWVLILMLYFFRKSWKIIVVGVTFSVLAYTFSPLHLRFEHLSLIDEAVADRVVLSKAAMLMFFDKPLLGVGLGNFLGSLPFYEKQIGAIFYIQPVHNIFLLILSETGIAGSLFTAFFFFKSLKRVISRKNKLCLLLFFEIFFLGFFDHYLLTAQQGQLMLAVALGLCWSSFGRDESDTIFE